MYLALLLLVMLLALIGSMAFRIREKQVESGDGDETKADDFEIIDVDTPTKSASEKGM